MLMSLSKVTYGDRTHSSLFALIRKLLDKISAEKVVSGDENIGQHLQDEFGYLAPKELGGECGMLEKGYQVLIKGAEPLLEESRDGLRSSPSDSVSIEDTGRWPHLTIMDMFFIWDI